MSRGTPIPTHTNAYRSISMSIYYLYIKTHKTTGLRYLGQTKRNPFKYPGSGIDWVIHLKKFGNTVHTEILISTKCVDERNKWGRYYSAYYNIIRAQDDFGNKIWANRIAETGGGGGYENQSEILKNALNAPEIKKKMLAAQKRLNNDPIVIENKRKASQKKWTDPVLRQKVSGINNPKYDHTIYKFIHISGLTENCTRQELIKKYDLEPRLLHRIIKRIRKSHRGWAICDK